MRYFLIAFSSFVLFVPQALAKEHQKSVVLNYDDLGPQVVSYKLIGYEWWQWDNHGDSKPREYDIKVVVYRNIGISDVKKTYPVIPEKKQDYRYIKYSLALEHLNNTVKEWEEDDLPILQAEAAKLRKTKIKIIEALGPDV